MKKLFLVSLVLLFSGCSLMPPQHYYGTDKIEPKKLAVIGFHPDEIKLLELDGEVYRGKLHDKVYVMPGYHRVKASLHWAVYAPNGLAYYHATSNKIIEGCINMKENKNYYFFARIPDGKIFEPRQKVYDKWSFKVGGSGLEKAIDVPACN